MPQSTTSQTPDADFNTERHDGEPVTDAEILPLQHGEFPVVGLGGSAGAIPALQTFFREMPDDPGMAFVVILHLSPDHESNLDAILGNVTKMPVVQVTEDIKFEINHVYVIPPAYLLTMHDGDIELTTLQRDNGRRVAVDLFLRALAETQEARAIGVILSGTDSDGSIGIKRVKERGGLTLVQDPNEAQYEEMPRNAIATGMVDWILPVAQMPARLVKMLRDESSIRLPSVQPPPSENSDADADAETALRQILEFLDASTGHNFAHYKRATVLRRIARRLQVNGMANLPSYLEFLRQNSGESMELLKDLLISVTNFFRDKAAFEALERAVPTLLRGKTEGGQLRAWVSGCATGEEAYSVAMILAEAVERHGPALKIQVFATDIDTGAIAFAREGLYAASIVADVSPERLRRFFVPEQGRYRVRKDLRETVLFAAHNLLSDSPFSALDLVSCRNLLIYFGNSAQERALELFHFALRPGGVLMLGSSESVGESPLFVALDKANRVFERREVPRSALALAQLPMQPRRRGAAVLPATLLPASAPGAVAASPAPQSRRDNFSALHLQLLEEYAPPSVLINQNYDILHLSDGAGRFLQWGGGAVSVNLLEVAPPELRLELQTALFQALQSGQRVEVPRLPVRYENQTRSMRLLVRPLQIPDAGQFLLVIFDLQAEAPPAALVLDEPVARRLEAELQHVRGQLQATSLQYEVSTEDLKASNEELQAMNEELRTATEELETGREELQSVNEELITVNAELKHKVEEVSNANSALNSLMASTDIATVFLDRQLCIKRYTPPAVELFNFIPTDTERPLSDLRHTLRYDALTQDAERVLERLAPIEREVQGAGDRWFLSLMSPYRTVEDRIEGVVLTFVDITRRKQAENELRQSKEHLQRAMEAGQIFSWELNLETQEFSYSRNMEAVLGFELPARIIQNPLESHMHPEDAEGAVQATLHSVETGEPYFRDIRFVNPQSGEILWLHSQGGMAKSSDGRRVFAGIVRNITEEKQAEEQLRRAAKFDAFRVQLNDALRPLFDASEMKQAAVRVLGLQLEVDRVLYADVSDDGETIHIADNYVRGDFPQLTGDIAVSVFGESLEKVRRGEALVVEDVSLTDQIPAAEKAEAIARNFFSVAAVPLVKAGRWVSNFVVHHGTPRHWTADEIALIEETAERTWAAIERARAEADLRDSEERYRALFESIDEGFCTVEVLFDENGRAFDYRFLQVSPSFERQTGIEDATGKRMRAIAPLHEELWFEIYGRVAQTGEPIRFENEAKELGRFYDVYAFRVGDPNLSHVGIIFNDITERKRAEEALRESEERFRLVLQNVEDYAILTTDQAGLITDWNVGAEKIFGWTASEAIGQRSDIIFTPEDRAKGEPEKEMQTALETGRAADERWHIRKNGEIFYVSGVLTLLKDGGVDGFVKIARDLTEQRKADALVRENEARLHTLSDAVPQIIWTNDAQGDANYFNSRWYEYSGLTLEESSVRGWIAIVHPDDEPASVERWGRALEAGAVFDTEYRLRRADGSYRWFIGRNVPLRDGDGEVLGWFGSATDIEELKSTEGALRESEERFRLLVEGTKDYAMFLMDTRRRIVHWNAGAERLFGYTRDEAVGMSGDMIFTPEDREARVPQQEAKQTAEQGSAPNVRWHIRKDGTRFWVDGITSSLRDDAGQLRGYAKIARDATKERNNEESLQLAHDELEERVGERTAELRSEITQRRYLERERARLLRGIVAAQEEERRRLSRELHDQMGQTLTALMMGLKMLPVQQETDSKNPTPAERLESLQNLAAELADYAHHLAWELRPAVLDNIGLEAALGQYVSDWSKRTDVAADFVAHGLSGRKRLPTDIESTLYRIAQEATSNVARHAQASQLSVLLERRGEEVVVVIEDDGQGFDLDQTTNRLGIVGMRERLELIGGTLDIESAPDEGTTIYARVPINSALMNNEA